MRKIINIFDAMDKPVLRRVSGGEPLTLQNKAMTPRELVNRLKAGSLDPSNVNVPVTNDDHLDDNPIPMFDSDELDLATFKQEFDRRTLAAKEETDAITAKEKEKSKAKAKKSFDDAVEKAVNERLNNVNSTDKT